MKLAVAILSFRTFCAAVDAACPPMDCPGMDSGSCAPIHGGPWCFYKCFKGAEQFYCNDKCNNCEGKGTPAPSPKPTPAPKPMPTPAPTLPPPKPTPTPSPPQTPKPDPRKASC